MVLATDLSRSADTVPQIDESQRYLNRELSWLQFNWRVLEEAFDPQHPLLERVKFLAIFSTNLDEFFMTRVAGLIRQVSAGVATLSPDGLTPSEQLAEIRRQVLDQRNEVFRCWQEILRPQLRAAGIQVLDYQELNLLQQAACRTYFEREVFPVLTPLAFDPSRPFPHISNLSLNIGVLIQDSEEGELFARVKVPAVLPRLVPIASELCSGLPERGVCFTWIDQIIEANIQELFPGMDVAETYIFRITRNADFEIEAEEAGDLLRTIEEGVRQRRFGRAVRISTQRNLPTYIRDILLSQLKLKSEDLYQIDGPLGISDLMELTRLERPDLKNLPLYPTLPTILRSVRSDLDIFSAIRQQDILLHHPFDSFQPVVDFIRAAAEDPNVLAIKQTLYRVGANSPVVEALMHASEEDKQVTVMVELKARFDEEHNITWARALERAGVHVVYGLMGLKTHAKIGLVVRREADGLRRYVHLGTGNYNATTARGYTDLGLLTARPEIGTDATDFFNFLTGYSRQDSYRELLVAPISLRDGLNTLIEREIRHARRGRKSRIIVKCNAIADPQITEALYQASQAGVQIDLLIRGVCCLRPGVPGLSEHISVRSIVGQLLEHSRICYFSNGGKPEVYLASGDLVERNIDHRVDILFPILDASLARYIRDQILMIYLRDNTQARLLQPDGSYTRLHPKAGERAVNSQAYFSIGRDIPMDHC